MKVSILALLAALFCVACSGNRLATDPPPMPTESLKDYTIGVGDGLQVQVWRSPELSIAGIVRPDGKFSVPLAGDVLAKGLTTDQLSSQLTEKLNQFVRNPQVTVIVTDPSSGQFLRRVRVTGAVRGPLSIPHQQGMTVLDVVLQAGGLTEFANGNAARLYRTVDGEMKAYPVRLNDILEQGKLETNYPLVPADVLTVPEQAI